ncbi:Alpha/beta hydrolase fold-1 [Mycena albidolilacea]|uniref:Alpha/beta hydrolase fold-1 n=1 Tax=Mycena albidolilacea TaxID=1033008 RepID=A0AAD7EJ25_9AGAR|nr:Alpha/beta hydrolase fold-1 [Mycena albidolilacea]
MFTASGPKPAIILIPASFSPLSLYTAVTTDLESHGYTVHGVELQTVGRRATLPSMYDDAAVVAAVASELAEARKDIVLVAHSYGGLVACEAAKGLAKRVREREGKEGGIARIVFVAAVVPGEGESLMDLKDDGYFVIDVARYAEKSYSDVPLDEALSWASQMREHAAASLQQKLTYAAYKDISVAYLVCEEDRAIVPELQNSFIVAMESQMGEMRVDRHSVKSGHHINASQPAVMAETIENCTKLPSL